MQEDVLIGSSQTHLLSLSMWASEADSVVLNSGQVGPRGHLAMSGDILAVTAVGKNATGL